MTTPVKKIFLSYLPKKKNEIGFFIIKIGLGIFLFSLLLGIPLSYDFPEPIFYIGISGLILILIGATIDLFT